MRSRTEAGIITVEIITMDNTDYSSSEPTAADGESARTLIASTAIMAGANRLQYVTANSHGKPASEGAFS